MGNTNRKIATIVIGLAGVVAAGATGAWTGAAPGQSPAGVVHLADGDTDDDMHWTPTPGRLPDQVPDDVEDLLPTIPRPDDDMHW